MYPGPIVDLGFGHTPVTTLDLARKLRKKGFSHPVLGLEIDPQRVSKGRKYLAEKCIDNLTVAQGGFNFESCRPAIVIRAANVLREYAVEEVLDAWAKLTERLSPRGLLLDATVSESGDLACWVALGTAGPKSLVISIKLDQISSPLIAATRLPKILINQNQPGSKINTFLITLDKAWQKHSFLKAFSPAQRFAASCQELRNSGWQLRRSGGHWSQGEVEVAWSEVG